MLKAPFLFLAPSGVVALFRAQGASSTSNKDFLLYLSCILLIGGSLLFKPRFISRPVDVFKLRVSDTGRPAHQRVTGIPMWISKQRGTSDKGLTEGK